MSLLWILVVVLIIVAVLGYPGVGPVQHAYGPYPSVVVVVLVVVLLLVLLGKL